MLRLDIYLFQFFFESLKCRKFRIVVAIIFSLCNENLSTFLTRLQKLFNTGYGQTGSKAHLPAFLQFLSNFNETCSISLSFRGRLNRALRSDLTPLHSAHFALHSAHFAPVFQLFCFSRFSRFLYSTFGVRA